MKKEDHMTTSDWFDDVPVLGNMAPEQAAAKLHEVGEEEAATAVEGAKGEPATYRGLGDWWPFGDKPWQYTAHAFGYLAPDVRLLPAESLRYLAPAPSGSDMLPIRHAGNIDAVPSLRNQRIKITLDRLRVADYPGGGTHRVLFDFYAQNQVAGDNVEHLHFNTTCRVHEGQQAAVLGYPIFVGLNVAGEGVSFKCFTVNVKNDDDEGRDEGYRQTQSKRGDPRFLPGSGFQHHRHPRPPGRRLVPGRPDSRNLPDRLGLERMGLQPGQRPDRKPGRSHAVDPVQLRRLQRQPA